MNFRQFHKISKLSCCMSFRFVNLQLWSVYYVVVALLLLLLLCTILHSSLLLALLCSYYYLTTTTLLSYIYYSTMSLSHSFLARLNCSFLATLLCFGRCLLCLLSPSLLLSGACCACSLHLVCCWCCLVLAVLPLSLSRATGANTRDNVFIFLRSGFWWDDRDGVQIQTHASC